MNVALLPGCPEDHDYYSDRDGECCNQDNETYDLFLECGCTGACGTRQLGDNTTGRQLVKYRERKRNDEQDSFISSLNDDADT